MRRLGSTVVPTGLQATTVPLEVNSYRIPGDTFVLECSREGVAMATADAKITAIALTSLIDTSVTH